MSLALKNLESLLYRLITAPSGVAEGLASEHLADGLARIVRGDDRLSAEDRVDIYANMYFYRLLDVLKRDFPATAAVLGDVNFHNLITSYLLEYPPTEPSLSFAGQHLAAFLRDHPLRSEFPYAPELAMLERTIGKMFCAPDATPVSSSEMSSIAPTQWGTITLRRVPACIILHLQWDVAPVLRAIEEGQPWSAPNAESNAVLVWRQNSRVRYRKIDQREAAAMDLLSRSVSFARVCDRLADGISPDEASPLISATLARWLNDGILSLPTRDRSGDGP